MEQSKPRLSGGRSIRWFTSDGGVAFILALVISAALLGLRPSITEGTDYQLMHQFYKFYLRASIRAGELPLWNPYVALGRPFLADMETATLYPPNWIFIVLPEMPALFLFLAFHFWLAGFFFIKIARHWAAPRAVAIALAFAYLMSGPFLGRLQCGLLGYFSGLAYWPLLFYAIERLRVKISWRRWLMLVLAASGSFLSGHPQCFWLTAVGLGLYLLGAHLAAPWRQNIRRGLQCLGVLASGYLAALMLCGVQLLPMIDLVLQGNRAAPDESFASWGAIGWDRLTSLFVSQPASVYVTWCETNLHVGVIVALAGLLGLMRWRDVRMRGLWLMGGIGLVLALGERTPLFSALFHLLPGMGVFRIAARYATLVSWAFLLAAVTVWPDEKLSRRRTMVALSLLMIGAVYAAWAGGGFLVSALASVVLLAGLALGAFWQARRGGDKLVLTGCDALLAIIWLNSAVAAVHMRAYYQHSYSSKHGTTVADMFLRNEAVVVDMFLKKNLHVPNGVPPRLFAPGSLIGPNSGVKYGFSNVVCYGSLTSMRVWSYLSIGAGIEVNYYKNTFLPDEVWRAGPYPFSGMNIAAGWVYGTNRFVFNPRPGERAWLAYSWEQLPDWTTALRKFVLGQVDPTKVALLEAPAEGPKPAGDNAGSGQAIIESFRRNAITLRVESSKPALLVVAEAWYPGWRATVNGAPAEVLPANVWMRAIRVPSGESRVRLYYVEPSLAAGVAISLGMLLLLAAIDWRLNRKQAFTSAGLE
jgi:hypothetical protein